MFSHLDILLLISSFYFFIFSRFCRVRTVMSRRGDSTRSRRENFTRRPRGRSFGPRSETESRNNTRNSSSSKTAPKTSAYAVGDNIVPRAKANDSRPMVAKTFIDWPPETDPSSLKISLSNSTLPAELTGVIGYCSERSSGEMPGTLTVPSDIQKSIQDAKTYLFGSELESSMRSSLAEYTKVHEFCDCW